MTVSELIEVLKEMPWDADVLLKADFRDSQAAVSLKIPADSVEVEFVSFGREVVIKGACEYD